jgi:biopolymer transport protein ExbD
MNLRSVRDEGIDINLTPLIDVVFLLLIFFMVSTTFVHESEIELTLPEASEEIRQEAVDKIEIAIDNQGARPQGVDPIVIISADAQASHQMVISVMDAARQLGLYRVTFPTKVPDGNDLE